MIEFLTYLFVGLLVFGFIFFSVVGIIGSATVRLIYGTAFVCWIAHDFGEWLLEGIGWFA